MNDNRLIQGFPLNRSMCQALQICINCQCQLRRAVRLCGLLHERSGPRKNIAVSYRFHFSSFHMWHATSILLSTFCRILNIFCLRLSFLDHVLVKSNNLLKACLYRHGRFNSHRDQSCAGTTTDISLLTCPSWPHSIQRTSKQVETVMVSPLRLWDIPHMREFPWH